MDVNEIEQLNKFNLIVRFLRMILNIKSDFDPSLGEEE